MRKVVYISGPMRGYPLSNYPLFNRVAAEQRALGYEVCSPAEYDDGSKPFVLREAMACFCKFICEEATHILMLPGWQASMGATTEYNLARNCNLVVEYYDARAVAVTVSDLHAVVPARTVQAYLSTYLTSWEAGGCEQRPTIHVRPNPNGGYTVDVDRAIPANDYEIHITHLET